MTAADWHARDAVKAFVLAHVEPVLLAVVILTLASATYCAGKSQGHADEQGHVADSLRKVYAHRSDSLEAVAKQQAVAAQRIAAQRDSLLRVHEQARQTFAQHVRVIDSNTVSIDNGPPVHEIPVSLAIPPIVTCDPVMQIDSAALHLKDAQIATITEDRDTWKQRALTDEAQKPSRFGFKSGVAAGATVVALFVHFIL